MRYPIIWAILLYQRVAPTSLRERCIFKKSCSNYVLEGAREQGTFEAFRRLRERVRRCKPGYESSEVEDFANRYFAGEDAQVLSAIIDVAAARFNAELELENPDKIDFKVKAKQFVKIYGQMAAIMPFEVIEWEKLFWFLKFLVPKLKVTDPNQDTLDELLESVDLSSYGLERVKLNHEIGLDASDTELDPQNPNPRGFRDGDPDTDPLDEIVRTFNERWFQGWSATPEEQRVKFVNIAESVRAHPDFEDKYAKNQDPQNRALAFERILKDVMLRRRKDELELYKLFAGDDAFKSAWMQSLENILSLNPGDRDDPGPMVSGH